MYTKKRGLEKQQKGKENHGRRLRRSLKIAVVLSLLLLVPMARVLSWHVDFYFYWFYHDDHTYNDDEDWETQTGRQAGRQRSECYITNTKKSKKSAVSAPGILKPIFFFSFLAQHHDIIFYWLPSSHHDWLNHLRGIQSIIYCTGCQLGKLL